MIILCRISMEQAQEAKDHQLAEDLVWVEEKDRVWAEPKNVFAQSAEKKSLTPVVFHAARPNALSAKVQCLEYSANQKQNNQV